MKKTDKSSVALFMALAATTLLGADPVRADQDCIARIMTSCTSCHFQTRICEKVGEKNRRAWKVTIKRMLRYGLVLDEAGQDSMLDCLVALEKNRGNLCK